MNGGRIRVWNGSRLLIDAEDTDAEAPAAGYLSLVGTGIQAEFSAFRLSSYHGVETPCVSSAVMRDQSYQDSFAAETGIWRYQGAEIRDGALRFAGSGNIGSATLEGRVFSECEVSFTCDLSGTQTTANAEDHWAGLTLGRETMYGDIWGYGGYLLLLRKTGRVELLSARGALASAQLESALDGPAQVRVVRRAGTIEVYVNGAEQPVLSASAPDYTEGFLSLNACGGEVSFDDFAVTGVRQNENSVLLDDFSGDLGRWKKVKEPERIAVADGKLCTSGVLVKVDAENGVQGKGVSPDLVYTERTFQNVRIGFDVRLKDIALTENWAGAYFHSGGTDGFWSSGGYLVYLTNLGNLVVYRAGSLASASIATDPMKQTVHLEVELRNGTIRVYVDYAAQPLIEVNDSTFTGGYFGLCSDFADAEFDNIYYFLERSRYDAEAGNSGCVQGRLPRAGDVRQRKPAAGRNRMRQSEMVRAFWRKARSDNLQFRHIWLSLCGKHHIAVPSARFCLCGASNRGAAAGAGGALYSTHGSGRTSSAFFHLRRGCRGTPKVCRHGCAGAE